MIFSSQVKQDEIVDRLLRGKTGGVFVEIGAFDGVKFSNSLFFEQHRGWTGLCIEPNPESFARLAANRKCRCIQAAAGLENKAQARFVVADRDLQGLSALTDVFNRERYDMFKEMGDYVSDYTFCNVPMRTVQSMLDECGISNIDYLSVDVEGSEMAALRSIDWSRTRVEIATVEDIDRSQELEIFMNTIGMHCIGRAEWDSIFRREP